MQNNLYIKEYLQSTIEDLDKMISESSIDETVNKIKSYSFMMNRFKLLLDALENEKYLVTPQIEFESKEGLTEDQLDILKNYNDMLEDSIRIYSTDKLIVFKVKEYMSDNDFDDLQKAIYEAIEEAGINTQCIILSNNVDICGFRVISGNSHTCNNDKERDEK